MVHLRIHSYGTAILSVGFALLLMLALDPVARMTQTPFLLFFGAVVVSAWRGGMRSGLVATGLSALISDYFFLQPRYSLAMGLSEGLQLLVFILECILISALCGSLRTTNQRLDRSLSKLQTSEDSLRTANRHITDILESITDGFYTLDHQGQVVYVNQQAEHVLGQSRQELLGHSIWDIFPQGRGTQFEQYLHRAITEHRAIVFESFGIINPERCFEIHINPLYDGVAVYFQDVTQRKQAEDALRQSETVLNAFLSSSPIGMAFLDRNLRYVYANEALAAMNGIPLHEHLGHTLNEILPAWIDTLAPILQRVMQTKEAIVNAEISGETNPPGVYRYSLVNYFPVCLPGGGLLGVGVTSMDITELKQTEQALRDSEEIARARAEELETFMEVVPAAVWIAHDPECHTMTLNRAAYDLMRAMPGDATTATPADGSYPLAFKLQRNGHDIPVESLSMQKAGRTGQTVEEEAELVFGDGVVRYIYGKAVPLHDETGKVRGVIGAYLDISERKHAEAEQKRLMQELETERARFEAVLQQLPAGVMIADATSGMLVLTNEQAKHILGYSFEQSLPLEDYDPVVSFEALNANGQRCEPEQYPLMRSLRTGETVTNEEMEIHRRDGTCIVMSVNSAPILNHREQIVAAVTIFQDITERKCFENERKRTEATLRDREHHFSTLFNGMEDWVLVYRLTPDHLPGPFIEVNEQACRKLGYSREELLHMSVMDVISSPTVDWTHNIEHLFTEKRVFLESVHTTKDGRQIPCEVSATLFTLNGEPTVQSICRDITERKRAEEKQREDEERLQLALWAAKASTWDWNLATGTLVCSAEYYSLYGVAPDTKLTYANWLELVHEDEREMVDRTINAAVVAQEEIRIEFRIRHREQGIRWLMLVGRHFQDKNEQLVRITGITVDITERKQIEEERERLLTREQTAREAAETANRIKDEFLAVLSHELRSPLNPILGWAKLLQTRKFDEPTTQRALGTIERNAKLQTQLIEDLLDVSRILRGKLVLNMVPVNLATIIESALETVQPTAEAKSITITVEVVQPSNGADSSDTQTPGADDKTNDRTPSALAAFPFRVAGDAGRLQQIMWNLLSNAVKFTPSGGRVEVRLERVDSIVQIQVHDSGKGINPTFLPYVFEYFRQEDGKTTRQFGGLGLGLAIVRHLTELHGGTIHADSPGEDLGATFTVRFPLLDTSESSQGEHSTHSFPMSPSSHPLDGLKILIVDDEADMRELVFMVLQQYGAEVRVAASATEALHTLTHTIPDVLISDIGMPNMDGYMLMREVRSLPPHQGGNLPAIALTAYAGESDHKQAIAAGFQMHLPKPVDPEELVRAIINLATQSTHSR